MLPTPEQLLPGLDNTNYNDICNELNNILLTINFMNWNNVSDDTTALFQYILNDKIKFYYRNNYYVIIIIV